MARAATRRRPERNLSRADERRGGHPLPVRERHGLRHQAGAAQAVITISPQGRARLFASLPPGLGLSGIAFDATGRFGHRLLVTAESGGRTTVFAIGCDGRPAAVTARAPAMEGGITVAPATFGRFGGDLIGPDEKSGRVYAVDPGGTVVTLAQSGLPAGGDIGVESAGFVPPQATAAYLADRYSAPTSTPATTPFCGWPRRTWPRPESGPVIFSSPPRGAPAPSTSAAGRPALCGTSPPGRPLPTARGTSPSPPPLHSRPARPGRHRQHRNSPHRPLAARPETDVGRNHSH